MQIKNELCNSSLDIFLFYSVKLKSDTQRLIFAIPTILIIMIYDPRIASYMPGFIESALRFLQQTCAARLIGGVSWLNHSTDTAIYDGFYFTVFDMMIAGVYLFWYWSSSKND